MITSQTHVKISLHLYYFGNDSVWFCYQIRFLERNGALKNFSQGHALMQDEFGTGSSFSPGNSGITFQPA